MPKKKREIPKINFQSFLPLAAVAVAVFFVALFMGVGKKPSAENGKKLTPDPLIARYSPPGVESPVSIKSGFKIIGNIIPSAHSVRVPILLYHYIEVNKDPKDTIRQSLTVSPYWFEEQAKFLVQNGYTTITLEELTDALMGKKDLPPKPVILTFDDGYRDFYTDAFPILKKYNLKATNFVFPNVLNKKNNMDTWMIQEVINSGLVTIGSHTLSHAYLPKLSKELAHKEISESKIVLEQIIGKPVRVFAYPYGAFDQSVVDLVRQAGYTAAVATTRGNIHSPDTLYWFSRTRVGNLAGEMFKKKLEE